MIADTSTNTTTAAAGPSIQRINQGELHGSPTNPRKHFEPAPLQELSESIEEHGIQQPLLGRPSKTQPGLIEIVMGERRWRANEMVLTRLTARLEAGTDAEEPVLAAKYEERSALPVIVRDLDDATVLELQLIENLQRQDLTSMEEARGYERLLQMEGYTAEKIALKVGKPLRVVMRKLRLLQTPPELIRALEAGIISERVCTLVAGVPGDKARKALAKQVLEEGDWDHETGKRGAMTVRDVEGLIAEEYRVSLKGCKWKLEDAALVPAAGACAMCPHLAKNDPELADELVQKGRTKGVEPLTCLNPGCYRQKVEAHTAQEIAKAKEKKQTVLSEEEARKVFERYGGIKHTSRFVLVDRQPDYSVIGNYDPKRPTWKQAVKDSPVAVDVVLALNPEGELVELVDQAAAVEAARKSPKYGKMFNKAKAKGAELTPAQQREKAKEALKKKVEARSRVVTVNHLFEQAMKRKIGIEETLVMLDFGLREAGMDGCRLVADLLKVEPAPLSKDKRSVDSHLNQGHYRLAIMDHLKARDGGLHELQAMLMVALVSKWVKVYGPDCDALDPFYKHYGFDDKTVMALAKSEVEAEIEAAKTKAAEKAAKKGAKGAKAAANSADKKDWTVAGEAERTKAADQAAKGKVKKPKKLTPMEEFAAKLLNREVIPQKEPQHGIIQSSWNLGTEVSLSYRVAKVPDQRFSIALAADEAGSWYFSADTFNGATYHHITGSLPEQALPTRRAAIDAALKAVKEKEWVFAAYVGQIQDLLPADDSAKGKAQPEEAYYCDECHRVCLVSVEHAAAMEALPRFVCGAHPECTKVSGYATIPPLREELQAEYESWPTDGEPEVISVEALAKELDLDGEDEDTGAHQD